MKLFLVFLMTCFFTGVLTWQMRPIKRMLLLILIAVTFTSVYYFIDRFV